ncbi:MAG: RdgB/HAM1 family non-canonical purine NTP pyrophosphatase [Sphingomonadaceae bacterium]
MTDDLPYRKLKPGRLVIASHNPGKVAEIADLLGPHGVEPVPAAELDLPEPPEDGVTFVDNAELKARLAADLSGLPALADDSGLVVDALGGDPGVFSARWAGPDKDFRRAMRRVHDALEALGPDAGRNAHFVCALAVAWPEDGQCEIFEGRVEGMLVWPPRGDKGFGYDPMFVPAGHDVTFGEMEPEKKHAISHRADAFARLKAGLLG